MKTLLTTLTAAILALAACGAVQAGPPSHRHESKHTEHRFERERDSHRYEYHRERFYRSYCEYPDCDCSTCESPTCDCQTCESPVCEYPVCESPVCEYPACEYPSWDRRHRREHFLRHGGESKMKTSSSHRK